MFYVLDDGTRDHVLLCSDCGREQRYRYSSSHLDTLIGDTLSAAFLRAAEEAHAAEGCDHDLRKELRKD